MLVRKISQWSIRVHLIILVLMITLPSMAIILHDGMTLQKQAVLDAHQTALRFTNILAYQQERMTDTTRQLLSTIAQMQAVANLDTPASNQLLRQILKANPAYENFFIVRADGMIMASAVPFKPFMVTSLKYFRDAMATKNYSAGEYVTSMFSGRHAFHFSYPVLDGTNRVMAVVVAELTLDEYSLFFKMANLPRESILSVSDCRGIRLFTDPFNPTHPAPGLVERAETMRHMTGTNSEGTYTSTGTDGVKRLYGFRRLYLKERNTPYMYIRTGLSEEVALAEPRRLFLRNLLFIGAIFILAIISAWFLGDYLIVRRLRKLASATQILADGEAGVHTGLNHNEGELGELAAAFDKMADNLKKREDEKRNAEMVRQRLEIQLQHAQKMEAIGTLAGGIAHDFNNILASIIGNAELTMEETALSDLQREYLDEILVACNRAKDVIRQILSFSRQGEEQERYPLDITILVKEVVKLLRSILPKTIEIRQAITGDVATVMTNPAQIHQIVMNLATNAAHAMMREQGGILSIEVCLAHLADGELHPLPKGTYVRLTVSDTGTGIDPAIIDRIFDPFFTTKLSGEGTGLGLSVVYGIVKSIEGNVDVDSTLGMGTRVHVYLPHCPEHPSEEPMDEGEIPRGNERILLVDDDPSLTEIGRRIIGNLGYQVTAVTNSSDALAIFSNNPGSFDLLLTDMTMPNMTGMALAREVLMIRPDLPVILCTGYADLMNTEEANRLGVRAFVMKPLSRRNVAFILRKALSPDRTE